LRQWRRQTVLEVLRMFTGTQSSRVAEQITLDELAEATSTAVRRAVKEHENRLQDSPHELSTPILVGFLAD